MVGPQQIILKTEKLKSNISMLLSNIQTNGRKKKTDKRVEIDFSGEWAKDRVGALLFFIISL